MPAAAPTLTPDTDINRVLLSGHLAEDPDLYDLSPGPIVCFLRLRCDCHNAPALLGDEGQLDVSVIILGSTAANVYPYLKQSRHLIVDGALASAEHEATGSEPDETLCILAQRIEFMDGGARLRLDRRTTELLAGDEPAEAAAMIGFSEDAWA